MAPHFFIIQEVLTIEIYIIYIRRVAQVNRDHTVWFSSHRTEPGNTFACIATKYYALPGDTIQYRVIWCPTKTFLVCEIPRSQRLQAFHLYLEYGVDCKRLWTMWIVKLLKRVLTDQGSFVQWRQRAKNGSCREATKVESAQKVSSLVLFFSRERLSHESASWDYRSQAYCWWQNLPTSSPNCAGEQHIELMNIIFS